jgi:hypothetical protein
MSKKTTSSEDILGSLLGMTALAVALCIPFIMKALLYPFRPRLWYLLQLERHSLYWVSREWLYLPIKWIMLMAFSYFGFQVINQFRQETVTYSTVLIGILYIIGMLLCAVVFNAIHWMEQHFQTPSFQKKLAGIAAEDHVKKLVHAHQRNLTSSLSLHGALFVFRPGVDREFSVEADHVLITERNLFVIETKYKSGTISANATAAQWNVTTAHGQSNMRNALKQVKNTAQVLARECSLSCIPVPLVAMVGRDLTITDAPTNVVRAEEISHVIDAFEARQLNPLFDPDQVLNALRGHIATDKDAWQKHVARAEQAKTRDAMACIVESASIH